MNGQLARSQRNHVLEQVFSQAHEGIVITDQNNRIIDVNPAFCLITGYSKPELIGKNPNILSSGQQGKAFYKRMWQSIQNQGFWSGEVWNRKKDGSFYAEVLTVCKCDADADNELCYVGMISDVTQMKEHQVQLERLAHYDGLTQLPNRILLADRFNQAIAHSKRHHTLLAVCFLDLDNFKPVNDRYGHGVGDQLLIEVAKRILSLVRQDDTVSRYGGDEFVILLRDIGNRKDCEALLARLIDSLRQPFEIAGQQLSISASLGYTIYPFDQGSLDTLIRHADQTLYKAKLEGKDCFSMYDISEAESTQNWQQQLQEINEAIQAEQMQLYFQPKVNMSSGRVFGFEALVRWQHPQQGLLAPLVFLPVINGSDVEIQLGEWVIDKALEYLQQWQQSGQKLSISINLSAYHLGSAGFVERLTEIVACYADVDLSGFQLEILESHALSDLQQIAEVVQHCRQVLGISTVLDDFGTGYSSLSHIRTLPVTGVKIDQTFIRNMLNDPDDCKIVEGVIALARSFNLDVIAEGVESLLHGEILLAMGCELAQGYVIARPMPHSDSEHWLTQWQPCRQWQSYKGLQLTPRTANLKLFALYIQLAMQALEQRLKTDAPGEPALEVSDGLSCHCTVWLERAANLQIFDDRCLQRLAEIYQQFQQLLDACLLAQRQGQQSASDLQPRLKTRYQQLQNFIADKISSMDCEPRGDS